MPELPEVEVLVRHLAPLLRNKIVRNVQVRWVKTLAPTSSRKFARTLRGARFVGLSRRGKYLVFEFRARNQLRTQILVGHLGMTGRMYLLPAAARLPRHVAVILGLGREKFVFEDTRYFGRLTLDASVLARLGPEPLAREFTAACFARALSRSTQPIKIKLLDQSLVAGVGNIYASEALFRARLAPTLPACRLSNDQVDRLRRAIREVLREAIDCGSTVPLNYSGAGKSGRLFYFGRAPGFPDFYEERLRVYGRAGQPCVNCGRPIKDMLQAARRTFYCSCCQRPRGARTGRKSGVKSV